MLFQITYSFWILALTAVIAIIAASIAFRKRHLPGGYPFFLMLIAIAFYAFVSAMESAVVELNMKIFWSQFEYIGSTAAVILFLLFASEYTGKSSWLTPKIRQCIWIFPILHFLLAVTNPYHRWLWTDFTISKTVPNMIVYHHGPAFFYFIFFIHSVLATASILLIISSHNSSVLQRRQTRLIMFAALVPFVISFIYALDLFPFPGLNITPISFLATGILVLLAFYLYKFLHLVPIARDKLLEIMWNGMIVTDAEFRVVDINGKTLDFFGKKIDDVLGLSVFKFLPIRDSLIEKDANFVKCNHEIVVKNDSYYFEIRCSPVVDRMQKAIGYLFVIHDITVRKKGEEEREALIEELHQANETKSRFFSIISHDLRNPFITISEYVHLIKDSWDEMDKRDLHSLADDLYKSVKNTNTFLDNLLAWSRSQMGSLKFNVQPEALYPLMDSVLEILIASANKKAIEIVINIPDELWVEADANATCTVMRNLVSNAIKFTREGGKVEVLAVEIDHFIQVKIMDNGMGIDPLILKDLFHLDKTVTTPGTNNERGSGLGLILCKEFIEKQGGSISVESEQEKGSTFVFTLPKAEPLID